MAELSKEAKIILLVNAIIAGIFAFLLLAIPKTYFTMSEFEDYCPICVLQVGTIFLMYTIFNIIAIMRNEFDQVRLFWETGIVWLIFMAIVGLYGLFTEPGSVTAKAGGWFNSIIGFIIIGLNIFIYQRELKKQ